jgi:hypothetical protein
MAEAIIAADPFGVLRYGETADLSGARRGLENLIIGRKPPFSMGHEAIPLSMP